MLSLHEARQGQSAVRPSAKSPPAIGEFAGHEPSLTVQCQRRTSGVALTATFGTCACAY
jgi:hypothetical protein